MIKFITIDDKKKIKENQKDLTSLDKAILDKCNRGTPMNILRVLKAGRPYFNKEGVRRFASTDSVMASVDKLTKLGLLERR